MQPVLSLHVDNEPRMVNQFAVPEMSLSSSRATMKQHRFVIEAHASELVQYLEPTYAAWVAESKEDDELFGAPQDELAEAGYPNLNQLIETPRLLGLVVGHYLLQEFLGKLTWDGSSPIEYWLDGIIDCQVESDLVRLSGYCHSKAPRGEV